MGYWARLTKTGSNWLGVSTETPDAAIPLSVLAEFLDPKGEVSVWFVNDLEGALLRVAAALQKGDRPKALVFRVIDETALAELGVQTPEKDPGDSLDDALNKTSHFIFRIKTCGETAYLVRAFAGMPQQPISVKAIGDQIATSIRENFIVLKSFGRDMCKWLVENDKLVVAMPSTVEVEQQAEGSRPESEKGVTPQEPVREQAPDPTSAAAAPVGAAQSLGETPT